ncbi:Phage tail tube protein FII [Chromobacterium vaccinii]|nr:Phage tail tube protein FII [Chromobacterium vaccinii]QND91747.1 Phage tail tube protein FII [Chromobacterium vaccinii]
MLPNILRKANLFNEGKSFLDECLEVKLPDLELDFEKYRSGGMIGEVPVLKGIGEMKLEHKYSSPVREIVAKFGAAKIDAARLRWLGSYENASTGAAQTVEVVAAGRHKKMGGGDAKVGEAGGFAVETELTYYRLVVDGEEFVEIDKLRSIFKVLGVDLEEEHRRNVGLTF